MSMQTNPLLVKLRDTRAAGRMALCGYFLLGYPNPDTFYRLVRLADELDVIELGVPSDNPSMDGAVIASAHEVVTRQLGIHAEPALALAGGLRYVPQPRFIMTYANVGREVNGFLRLCIDSDIHGMIAPDIDPVEARYVMMLARAMRLVIISLVDARADDVTLAQQAEVADMIYLKASPAQQTGHQVALDAEMRDLLMNARRRIHQINPKLPVAVGIGLKTPEQIASIAELGFDMAIVGTRLVEHMNRDEQTLIDYIRALREATHYPQGGR